MTWLSCQSGRSIDLPPKVGGRHYPIGRVPKQNNSRLPWLEHLNQARMVRPLPQEGRGVLNVLRWTPRDCARQSLEVGCDAAHPASRVLKRCSLLQRGP